MTDAAELVEITMSDVRLVIGEGKLSNHDVLAAVNALLRMRAAQQGADDQRGMIWWNSLSDEGRKKWVQPSGRAVDAWMAFKLAVLGSKLTKE